MRILLSLIIASALLSPVAANAQNTHYTAQERAYLVPYIGYFDVVGNDNTATQFGLEYRFAARYWNLRPAVGANFTTDGSAYGYGGVFWDMDLWGSGFFFTPNFVAGIYHSGDGKSLGGPVEFRTGAELSYSLQQGHRVGVAFNHISNAEFHDRNPGAETLLLNYHFPF